MTDQTQRLELATVKAEIASDIVSRFSNDPVEAEPIPTDSGDIQNLKQVSAGIEADGQAAIVQAVAEGIVDLTGSVFSADQSADRSELAASVSMAAANQYLTVADGIAATVGTGSTNRLFSVPGATNDFSVQYRNDAGAAVEIGRSPSAKAVDAVNARISRDDAVGLYRDGAPGFAFPIMGKTGNVVGFLINGGVYATHLEIPSTSSMPARDGPLGIPIIQSLVDRKNGIVFNPNDGRTDLLLSDSAIRFIADNIGGVSAYLPPSDMRGSYAVFSVRKNSDFNIAAVQDRGGQTYDGKQLASGTYDTIVADRTVPMEFDPSYGQSNAGQGGTAGVLESRKLWPHTALSFDGRFQMQGNNGLVDGSTLTDLVPVYDPTGATVGQYPATMRAIAWAQLQCDNGIPQAASILASAWQGSQPAGSFLPGTNNYTNLMTFAARAKVCATKYGRTVECRFLTYIQGENGTNWAADFASMADAVIPALKTALGQASVCDIALWQIVGAAPDNGVGALQIAASKNRTDTKLVGAMYPFPIFDTLHLTALGRLMQGDVHAEFRLQVALGKTWSPLGMNTAVRSGATVTIAVALPPGTKAVSKDVDWVPQVSQDGFVYRDDSGDTAITAVAYSGSTITLTLASVPSGANPRIRYALDNGPGAGWYAMAGNAVALTDSLSPSHRLGHATPKYIRHNLLRQQIGVTA
ncbi:hypothetical protein JJD66_12470 [Pseudomonas sp. MF6751]|uniref:hypothetical protein n=1 Tax=Pseudomonas sp. MF6751 TaxID=2797528 RepID=UPI001909B7CC|nr:hypothetical protein [Pseudomonas sp. MF6751]MBK3476901.1 hypothetical protein [Pseudomonas sp. MF6751]